MTVAHMWFDNQIVEADVSDDQSCENSPNFVAVYLSRIFAAENVNKQTYLVDERFILKLHQNTTNYSYIVKKTWNVSRLRQFVKCSIF